CRLLSNTGKGLCPLLVWPYFCLAVVVSATLGVKWTRKIKQHLPAAAPTVFLPARRNTTSACDMLIRGGQNPDSYCPRRSHNKSNLSKINPGIWPCFQAKRSWVEMLLNLPFKFEPIEFTAAIMATEIPAAMSNTNTSAQAEARPECSTCRKPGRQA